MSSVSNEELKAFVEQFIKDSKLELLTAEDVLREKKYKWVRDLAEQNCMKAQKELRQKEQAEAARRKAELDKQKAEEAAKLATLFRENIGLTPLSPEELQERIDNVAVNGKVAADIFPPSEIPPAVIELSKELGGRLPDDMFKSPERAVTFRGWLAFWHKNLQRELDRDDLFSEYREALENRKRDMKSIFDNISAVVAAWGYDPRKAKTSPDDFHAMRTEMEAEGSRFFWLTQAPKVETAEEKAAREQEKAMKEAERQRFEEFVDSLKVRLIETNPELGDETAKKMANRLAKKYDQTSSDINQIFATAATHRMVSAKGQEAEERTAKIYARAAGMTDEAFKIAVDALHEQHAIDAQAQAERDRESKAHHGTMKPETVAAHASKKNGQAKKKDKNKKK
ncbi:MAG: hypothetical protein G01um101413_929 [Parcubacteria group bacterium Gr01-1014_13]|nr:MAG: hypothetical protein G01um101413_929 [Parcubacteria group bacterium Gr01-1014_13]